MHERSADCNAIEVVRDDATPGSRILPAQDRVEDSPPTTTVDLGTAALLPLLAEVD